MLERVPDELSGGPHFAAYCERYIRHTKGRWAGKPLVYEEWQRDFWWEAFEINPATGLRIYNEVGLGLTRKNSKSTMASGAGLYLLSDLSSGVTGETHHVDAGYHIVGMKQEDAPDIALG